MLQHHYYFLLDMSVDSTLFSVVNAFMSIWLLHSFSNRRQSHILDSNSFRLL